MKSSHVIWPKLMYFTISAKTVYADDNTPNATGDYV